MNLRGAGICTRHLLGEQVFQRFAVFEIDWHIEIARDVGLGDVELLEQGGEELAGIELFFIMLRLVILRAAFLASRRAYAFRGRSGAASGMHRSFASLRMTSRESQSDISSFGLRELGQVFPE